MENKNLLEILIIIFDFVSDFVKNILNELMFCIEKPGKNRPPQKKNKLTTAEILTIGIFRYFSGIDTWKKYYNFLKTYHSSDFPNLPNYQNFIKGINKLSFLSIIMVEYFMNIFRKNTKITDLKFVDSSKLEVCKIKREFTHKVCARIVKKSKSSMGWFYGFKLHIVCNELMQILDFRITAGNVDDRKGLEMIWNKIFGIIIADAGYLSKELGEKTVEGGKQLITAVRGNMENLMTKFQHGLLRARQKVEMVFSVLKVRFHLETSLPRSEIGYFTHYILCLTAYQFNKFCKVAYSMPKLA